MTAGAPAPAAASLSTTLNKGNIILSALEQRENAAVPLTLELHPPPQPVPRRKRPFLLRRPPAAPPPPAEAPVVLDGFVLLETCRVEDPEEAERAVLEGCSISAVVGEDLPFFTRLTHLDLGDNAVQLEGLAYLPALQELHLDCNGLTDLACPPGGFPRLEVLNLSYNAVPPASLLALADLPKLRELDLSNNGLAALPADLSGFGALQRLNCDHNQLGSVSSWVALASLPRLRALSLAHNRVARLPPDATADGGLAQLSLLSLAHNQISREDDLLPVLQLGSLRALLLYGNPFLHHGRASADFESVLIEQVPARPRCRRARRPPRPFASRSALRHKSPIRCCSGRGSPPTAA